MIYLEKLITILTIHCKIGELFIKMMEWFCKAPFVHMKKDNSFFYLIISLIYLMLIIILLQRKINYHLNILWKFGGSKHRRHIKTSKTYKKGKIFASKPSFLQSKNPKRKQMVPGLSQARSNKTFSFFCLSIHSKRLNRKQQQQSIYKYYQSN